MKPEKTRHALARTAERLGINEEKANEVIDRALTYLPEEASDGKYLTPEPLLGEQGGLVLVIKEGELYTVYGDPPDLYSDYWLERAPKDEVIPGA